MGSKIPSNSDTKSPPRPTVTPRFSRSMVCRTLIRIFEMFLFISLAFYKAHLWFPHPFREFDLTGHSEPNVHCSLNSLWNHEMDVSLSVLCLNLCFNVIEALQGFDADDLKVTTFSKRNRVGMDLFWMYQVSSKPFKGKSMESPQLLVSRKSIPWLWHSWTMTELILAFCPAFWKGCRRAAAKHSFPQPLPKSRKTPALGYSYQRLNISILLCPYPLPLNHQNGRWENETHQHQSTPFWLGKVIMPTANKDSKANPQFDNI